MTTLLAIGAAIGISSTAGLRAFWPLAVASFFGLLGIVAFPQPFGALSSVLAVIVLVVLALAEGALDRMPSLSRVSNLSLIPFRVASGAVLFDVISGIPVSSSDVSASVPALIAGGVIAGVVAFLKIALRPVSSTSAAGVSSGFLSAVEDVVALVGGVISAVFVPLVALVLVAFALFFFYRVRRRRGRKYEGLRILGD